MSSNTGPRNGHTIHPRVSPLRITALIPAFNQERRVAAAVWSVLQQSYPVFEILVVDDGSTDHTGEVVHQIPDKRIRVLHQSNRGVSAARNLGIAAARGDWIAFLDADDQWMPRKLERQVNSLVSSPALGWCAGNSLLVTQKKGLSYVRPFSSSSWDCRPRVVPAVELLKQKLYPWQMPTVIVRKAILEGLGGFDESLHTAEDLDLYLRVARTNPKISYHPQPDTLVFESRASLSRQRCDALQMVRKHFTETGHGEIQRRDLIQFLALVALHESYQSIRRLAWNQAAGQLRQVQVLWRESGAVPCLSAMLRLPVLKLENLLQRRMIAANTHPTPCT
jgi:glycosyltransferase involved in cell wall biosynthesis